jgi:lipopolysaccharide biosynthesis glycosyltransferase
MDDNTDLLVYTTSEFKERLSGIDGVLFFEKNFYKTMNQARISKVDIFDYPEINKYAKILYLDADSLVLAPIKPLFDAIVDDVVYAVGEGTILCEAEYWGRSLFLRDNADTEDREGLGAFALGFKNIPEFKKLFIKIKQAFYLDMYQNKLRFYDQPFLNFYLILNNACNTQVFKQYIRSRPSVEEAIQNNVCVAHFSGCPGHANVKLELIDDFISKYHKPVDNNQVAIVDALNKIKALVASIELLL